MEQFRDFQKYVKGVDPYGMQSGIVLIDPPEEWYVDVLLPSPPSLDRRWLIWLQETCPHGSGRSYQNNQDQESPHSGIPWRAGYLHPAEHGEDALLQPATVEVALRADREPATGQARRETS